MTVLFHMGVERCIHRSLNVALKLHQIDAIFKKNLPGGACPRTPLEDVRSTPT